jgi:hypothetical protein
VTNYAFGVTEATKPQTKLWHDDVRSSPGDDWTWARTNLEAIRVLMDYDVTEASLDHDLGLHDVDPDDEDAVLARGASPDGDGVDLVKAMIALRLVPPKIRIHSWNVQGANYMAGLLTGLTGAEVTVEPYNGVTEPWGHAIVAQVTEGMGT